MALNPRVARLVLARAGETRPREPKDPPQRELARRRRRQQARAQGFQDPARQELQAAQRGALRVEARQQAGLQAEGLRAEAPK